MSLVSNMDSIYATRVLMIMLLPFKKQKAYSLGLIDDNGNKVRNPVTQEEKETYDPLHQVLFRLKKLIYILPGGDFRLKQLAIVLQLIRQKIIPKQYMDGISEEYATEYLKRLIFVKENNLVLIEEEEFIRKQVDRLFEEGEGPTTNTGGIASGGIAPESKEPVVDPKKKKPKKEDIVVRNPLRESVETLYVSRKLINATEFVEWAKSQGFETTLFRGDLHTTICYSKTPVDISKVDELVNGLPVNGGKREVMPLGDGGATVLTFESPELQKRWQEYRDAGASWDWDSYTPHVTISYTPSTKPINEIVPFAGRLEFGPEIHAPLDEDWKDNKIEEDIK